jgi:hypothetical protein
MLSFGCCGKVTRIYKSQITLLMPLLQNICSKFIIFLFGRLMLLGYICDHIKRLRLSYISVKGCQNLNQQRKTLKKELLP